MYLNLDLLYNVNNYLFPLFYYNNGISKEVYYPITKKSVLYFYSNEKRITDYYDYITFSFCHKDDINGFLFGNKYHFTREKSFTNTPINSVICAPFKISKEDLDLAIQMDNELYNSGLTGTLKFSKKFRGEFGYGLPGKYAASGGGSGGRSGGGSGGSDTNRAYLSSLVPGIKSDTPAPKFSSKSRTTKSIQGVANLPSKSGKRISIRL